MGFRWTAATTFFGRWTGLLTELHYLIGEMGIEIVGFMRTV